MSVQPNKGEQKASEPTSARGAIETAANAILAVCGMAHGGGDVARDLLRLEQAMCLWQPKEGALSIVTPMDATFLKTNRSAYRRFCWFN